MSVITSCNHSMSAPRQRASEQSQDKKVRHTGCGLQAKIRYTVKANTPITIDNVSLSIVRYIALICTKLCSYTDSKDLQRLRGMGLNEFMLR